IPKPFAPDEFLARVARPLVRAAALAEGSMAREAGDALAQLTPREVQLLGMLAQGKAAKAIAAELYISPKTVATHIQRILAKLGVHSRTEAVSLAFRHGPTAPHTVA